VLIRYYLSSKQEKKDLVQAELTNARYDLGDLNGEHNIQRQMEMSAGERRTAALTPDERKKLLEDIQKKVDSVVAETTEVPLVAQAKNILADAYVQLALLGNPPEATTRPELALRPSEDLLDDASHAYQAVLDMKEGLPPAEAADAHFGLGAIAENRRDWDKARSQYEAVKNDPGMPKVFTNYAVVRLGVLDKISGPFVVGRPMTSPADMGTPPTPATGPTTTTGPTTDSTTAPAAPETPGTVPVTPGTAPATRPTTSGT
jgi:hypothetical protein